MYPDGGRILARMEMRNKLFILHGLSAILYENTHLQTSLHANELDLVWNSMVCVEQDFFWVC